MKTYAVNHKRFGDAIQVFVETEGEPTQSYELGLEQARFFLPVSAGSQSLLTALAILLDCTDEDIVKSYKHCSAFKEAFIAPTDGAFEITEPSIRAWLAEQDGRSAASPRESASHPDYPMLARFGKD